MEWQKYLAARAPDGDPSRPHETASPHGPGGRLNGLRWVATAIVAALASFLAARYALALLAKPGGVALFWPASGLSVGALLALGRRSERPLAAGVAVGTFLANETGDRSVPLALVFAAINVLELVLTARFAEWLCGRPFALDTLRRVFGFFIATCLGAGAAALVATLAIAVLQPTTTTLLDSWQVWFRSDVTGIAGIAPLLISVCRESWHRNPVEAHLEGGALLALLGAGSFLLFSFTATPYHFWTHIPPVAALFPLLLLVAARLPLFYASAAVTVVTIVVVATAVSGAGRFSDPSLPLTLQAFYAQMVIVSAAICSLALAALVAERRVAEEHQRMLISQLDHRVKNSLALMQAVIARSQESARSIDDLVTSLGGRIRSMARTQSKLSEGRWSGLCLAALITDELAPFNTAGAGTIAGPPVRLQPSAAQAISLVLHELATNAAKYGALSNPLGRVTVSWVIERDASTAPLLKIEWRESGGPPVSLPKRESFGASTIRELLPYELGGTVALSFEPGGVRCAIVLPTATTVVGLAP